MNGEPMEWVGKIKHLGNILSSNLSDKNDVIYKKGQFIGNVNRIIAQFGYTQLPVKCKLFNSYCSVFYGSSLWDLSSAHVSSFCTAWNKAVRILCHLPYRTHTVLLPQFVNTLSMQDQLILRSIKFIANMLQSENSIVKTVIQRALHTAYTPIGRNIAYIKSCVSPCCINCTHVNPCKLLWNQLNYTDIDVINNGNSIIELCNIRDGLLNYMFTITC